MSNITVKKCANGHFFDIEKYAFCPTCGAGPEETQEKKQTKSKSLFSWGRLKENSTSGKKRTAENQPQTLPEVTEAEFPTDESDITEAEFSRVEQDETEAEFYKADNEDMPAEAVKKPISDNVTVGIYNPLGYVPASRPVREEKETSIPSASDDTYVARPVAPVEDPVNTRPLRESREDNSLDTKTTGIFNMGPVGRNEPAGNVTSKSVSGRPCVGWLVCIHGALLGKSFEIYEGRNSVGRSDSNMIVLAGDTSVSREKHLWISFDYKKSEFYLSMGDGSSTVYVNDEMVMDHVKLAAKDRIEIGAGKYIFVPLCGEDFSWESFREEV